VPSIQDDEDSLFEESQPFCELFPDPETVPAPVLESKYRPNKLRKSKYKLMMILESDVKPYCLLNLHLAGLLARL
jgi:hypothetical protein